MTPEIDGYLTEKVYKCLWLWQGLNYIFVIYKLLTLLIFLHLFMLYAVFVNNGR